MRYQKKWRVTAALLAAALAASCVTGCSGGQENAETAGNTEAEGSKGTEGAGTAESGSSQSAETETRDSVVVVMGPTSEPEAGFDPAYGWGAGEHVHEPLIQSTLTSWNAASDPGDRRVRQKGSFLKRRPAADREAPGRS